MKKQARVTNLNIYYVLSLLYKYNGISFSDMPKILKDNGLTDFENKWVGNIRRCSIPEISFSTTEKKFFYDKNHKKFFPLESYFNKNKDVIVETIFFLLGTDNINPTFRKKLYKLLERIKNNNLFMVVEY